MNAEIEDFSYSAIFTYEGIKETPTIIHVTGRGICPTVRISKSLLQYGECNVNDYKDSRITIENKNPNIPINVSCNKIPYFSLSPTETTIAPKGIENLIATFRPKGKNYCVFLFLNNFPFLICLISLTCSGWELLKMHAYPAAWWSL